MSKSLITQIKEVEDLIKGKTFDETCKILNGFNRTKDYFDYNYGDFCSTIYEENGNLIMSSKYDIWDDNEVIGYFTFRHPKTIKKD